MITGELKNKVDGIWDIFWSNGVSNPLTVIEQLTYLMFIKILDDNETRREADAALFDETLDDPTFDAEHQNCRWSVFRNYEPEAMFSNMLQNVFPFIKNDLVTDDNAAFAKYMKDATFLVSNARTLTRIVAKLDEIDLGNKDIMGDVYEYLLSKLETSGQNGQFRTPRHIIRMMAELMEPTPDDIICDPAMGSAGFICAAAAYIKEHYSAELMDASVMQRFQTTMFTGHDTDSTMMRIGAMNLMLHGVDAPNITQIDSLSEDNDIRDAYTLIMANPPFKGSLDKETIAKDLRSVAATTKNRAAVPSAVPEEPGGRRTLRFHCARRRAVRIAKSAQGHPQGNYRRQSFASSYLHALRRVQAVRRRVHGYPHFHTHRQRWHGQRMVLRHGSRRL